MDGESILSEEGTTQGDPLAMCMYALGMMPLIRSADATGALQSWYADDSSAAGRLRRLWRWWSILLEDGPKYGYFVNAKKSVLVVKEACFQEATAMFRDTGVVVTCEGSRFLGAAIGSHAYLEKYVMEKVDSWCSEVRRLSRIAQSQPQAAYAALVHGLQGQWSFLCRAMSVSEELLQPLEDALRDCLIPVITSHTPPGSILRRVFALPCRLGGLGMINPRSLAHQFHCSLQITRSLVDCILSGDGHLDDALSDVRREKAAVRTNCRQVQAAEALDIMDSASESLRHVVTIAKEKGPSSWLTCRPLKKYGFALSKQEFWDGLCLRYGWSPVRMPGACACGGDGSVAHALSCPLGGFPPVRHNAVRDCTAKLLKEVCHNVSTEPLLQPLTGEQLHYRSANVEDNARLDVAASGLWGSRFERTLMDIRVFNPHARSNRCAPLTTVYQRHEREKRRHYEQRVREVEHATFVPVVLSACGGMGKAASALFKRIAVLIAEKRQEHYGQVISCIRCKLSFAILRSCIMCIRDCRRLFDTGRDSPAALMVAEARVAP